MSREKTLNLGLHKWAPEDNVSRTEFNDNFGKLDEKFAEKLDQALIGDLALIPQNTIVDALKDKDEKIAAVTAQLGDKVTPAALTTALTPKTDKTYVDTKLGEKLDKTGLIGPNQIDKNLGKFDQSYMSPEFLQQIAGTAPVNAVPAYKSVTPDKLAFDPVIGQKGKNLFNKATAFLNQNINTTTGALTASAGVFVSDFIDVKSNTVYSLTKVTADSMMVVYFDSAKQLISSASNPATITTPANATFIRFRTAMTSLDIAQLEEGSIKTAYEPYGNYLLPQFVRENSIEPNVLKKGITPEKTTFFTNSKNLFNKDAVTNGYYVSASTGNLSVNALYAASDFIPVEPNGIYARSYINQLAFYDLNKVYISGISTANGTTSFTVPANSFYVRVSVWGEYLSIYQLEKGSNATVYESFGYKIPKSFISKEVLSETFKIKAPADIFGEFAYSGQPFKVKLMGDSITHGAGGTGRADDGDLIPGTTFRMNPNGHCWANSLRDLLQGKYNAQVVNYAQSGTNSSIMFNQRNTLIEDDDDILIMQIGTNDRSNIANTTLVKQYQRGIIETAYAKGVKVILMSACPATIEGDNDSIRNFGMFDVDNAMRELANEYGMEHISNYNAFLQYAELRNISMDTLLTDGLHPNDAGYDVMFRNIVRSLGLSYIRPGITK